MGTSKLRTISGNGCDCCMKHECLTGRQPQAQWIASFALSVLSIHTQKWDLAPTPKQVDQFMNWSTWFQRPDYLPCPAGNSLVSTPMEAGGSVHELIHLVWKAPSLPLHVEKLHFAPPLKQVDQFMNWSTWFSMPYSIHFPVDEAMCSTQNHMDQFMNWSTCLTEHEHSALVWSLFVLLFDLIMIL